MERILLLLFVCTAFLASCKDNSDDVAPNSIPEVMRVALMAQFPNATNVEWEKAGQHYEVDFEVNTVDYDALMTTDGTILKYKHDIPVSELPQAVATAISTKYPGLQIEDPEKLYEGKQLYYQVELDDSKADLKLVFSEDAQEVTTPAYWD